MTSTDVLPTIQQAVALHRAGNLDQAERLYQQVLQAQPTHLDALQMLGVLKFQSNRLDEGVALLRRVLAIDPRQAGVHNNLGNALREMGQHQAAIESLTQAITLDPAFADAYSNRANTFSALARYDDAVADYQRAIALRPDHVNARHNYGLALAKQGRHRAACDSFSSALALNPRLADAYLHRSTARIALLDFAGTVQDCDAAVALNPGLAMAYINRAFVLIGWKQHAKAARTLGDLLAIDPAHPYLAGHRLDALLHACEWEGYETLVGALVDDVRDRKTVVSPFTFLAVSGSPADQLACARIWSDDLHPPAAPLWTGQRYAHPRIRLAYLSADFHNHATAHLMAELFELHDRARFECHAYAFGPAVPGAMRDRLQAAFDQFLDVSAMDDLQVAQLLQAHEIDIAIDLKGFTAGSRPGILAHRPAPIQVNYLGYPGTLGASTIDYILGDHSVTPAGHDGCYAERVVRLPDSYQVNDRRRAIASATPARADCGLPTDGFVFCCFNNSYKISPHVFDIWLRLLGLVPGSVLWLLQDNDDAVRNLRLRAQKCGVAPERLVFAPRVDLPAHLARHRLADLFLDTLPYNAHTTASDALWAGLPVLTCLGEGFAGRVAASLLRATGLAELVTQSLADYEALALALATQPQRLEALRTRLAAQRDSCALFDTDRFRRHIETAYETMYARHQSGLAPVSFSVAPLDDGGGMACPTPCAA